MSRLAWWRNTDNLPEPQRIDVPTPVYPVVDRTEPTCPEQLPNPQLPAPEWVRGSAVGMCREPGRPAPYDESADEIGGTKHYDDYLES